MQDANFSFATCGWELGPVDDKSYFDRVLSSDIVALSSIDQRVGYWDVDPVYAQVCIGGCRSTKYVCAVVVRVVLLLCCSSSLVELVCPTVK